MNGGDPAARAGSGMILRPLTADVRPTIVQNRLGVTAAAADGDFTFDFSVFEPSQPITFVVVGKSRNFEWMMTPEELARLK